MKNDCSKTGPKSQYTFGLLLKENSSLGLGEGQMVKVLAFPPMIRVQIPLTPTGFPAKFVFEKTKNKQKRDLGWPTF